MPSTRQRARRLSGPEEGGTVPRAKPKPQPPPPAPPAPAADGPAGEVLTLPEAAAYLRFSEADVLHLVEEQNLPARRMAN
jgi:hypothetical protein